MNEFPSWQNLPELQLVETPEPEELPEAEEQVIISQILLRLQRNQDGFNF